MSRVKKKNDRDHKWRRSKEETKTHAKRIPMAHFTVVRT